MRLVYGDEVLGFVRYHTVRDKHEEFGPATAIGVSDGSLVAGVVYSHYSEMTKDIHLTIAAISPRWAAKGIIRALFHYPYMQLDCQRTTVQVRKKNTRSLKLAEGLGYKVEGVIRRGFGDDDRVILGMLREECKWIGECK